jgi:ribosome-binding factor A
MSYRPQRVGSEIQRLLPQIIRELGDQRITEMISVTGVQVDNDLAVAKVYVSIYGQAEAMRATYDALVASCPFLQRQIVRELKHMRTVPTLRLYLDESMDYAAKIVKLIDDVNQNKQD